MKTIIITGRKMDVTAIQSMRSDYEVERWNFVLPSSYDGVSLPLAGWGLGYQRADALGDIDERVTVTPDVEAGTLTIAYSPKEGITGKSGNVTIWLQCIDSEGRVMYQTLPSVITVARKPVPTNTPDTEDFLDRAVAAALEAGAARDASETARDGILENAGFQAVSGALVPIGTVADAVGSVQTVAEHVGAVVAVAVAVEEVGTVAGAVAKVSTVADSIVKVGTVADSIVKVEAVADGMAHVTAVEAKLTEVGKVAAIDSDVAKVALIDGDVSKVAALELSVPVVAGVADEVAALAPIKDEIASLEAIRAEIISLEAVKTEVEAVEAKLTEIQGVYAKLAAIEGVYGKSTEIDALYAQLDTIAAKANQADLDAVEDRLDTLEGTGEGSVAKAIDDALALKFDKSSLADDYDGGATKALSAEKGKDLNARLTAAETAIDYLNNRSVKIYGAAFGVTSDTSERLFDAVGLVPRRANGSVNSEKSDFLSVGPWARMKKVLFDNTSVIKAEMGDTLFNALRATDTLNEGTKFEKFYSFDGEVTIGGVRKRVMLVSDYNVKHIYLGENEGSPVYVDLTCEPKFIREDGTERPYTIISSCHTGRDSAGTLWFGKPGVFPEVNRSIVNFDTLYPTGMYGYHFASSSILEKLLSIEWCSLNSQASVGAGINASMPYGSGNEFKCTVSQTGANSIIIANAGAVNMRVGMVMQIGTSYTSQNVAANRTITAIEDYDASNKRIAVDGAAFDSVSGTTTIVSWGQPVPKIQLESMGLDCGWISQFDSENRSHVFAYGIADVWGNVWSFERGKMRNNGRWYFCWHPAKCKSVSNPVGAPGYIDSQIDFYMPGNGYLKEVQFFTHEGKSTWFPKAVGASSASYYADYCYYFTSDYTGVRVVLRFGDWGSGSGDGLWVVYGSYTPGDANFYVSDRGIQDAA